MGYTTEFDGEFAVYPALSAKLVSELRSLNKTRHGYDTHPSIWCGWVPTDDGEFIIWDGAEKFYNYVEWLQYIIDNHLKPNGYSLTGKIRYRGEDFNDMGVIIVDDNVIGQESF